MLKLTKIFKEEFGHTNKCFGQHFLVNEHFLKEIVSSLDFSATKNVLEIGPGCGALTYYLLENGLNVTAVEIDPALTDFLSRYLFFYSDFEIINKDILSISEDELPNSFVVAGNLPYNLSTRILMKMTEFHNNITHIVFMFQKEVASRINASPKTRDYSWISVISQYFYDIRRIRNIGGGNFWPKTKVESTVLSFKPKERCFNSEDEEKFINFVKKSFKSKRKTLKNNLSGEIPDIEDILTEIFGKRSIRGEELELKNYIELYNHVSKKL